MGRTEMAAEKQNLHEHYLVYSGNDVEHSEFIAEFAQLEAVQKFIKVLFQDRSFNGNFLYVAKQSKPDPILRKEDLDGIIGKSGEIFMDGGKVYD